MSVIPITGNAYGKIEKSEVKTRGAAQAPLFTDDAALKLCVQDAASAEQWIGQKQWPLAWQESDILYQSPRAIQQWENSTVTRANVARFTVAKHVNSLVPSMMSGIFYDSPPFILRPRPGTSQKEVRARTSIIAALLDDIGFKTECERGMESQVLKGTGIWKWGCYAETKIEKHWRRKTLPKRVVLPFTGPTHVATKSSDEFEQVEIEVKRWKPFFEFRALGTVLVAPGWRFSNEIHRAKFVVDRQYMTFRDLLALKDQPGYNIPSEAELKDIFFPQPEVAMPLSSVEMQQANNTFIHHAERRDMPETADPLDQPLKVDERWDNDRVITAVQDKLVIRNETHDLGIIPFLSANWWNIENAGYGLGVGRLVGTEQRIESGAMNAALDILAVSCNPQYAVAEGANVPTQQIRTRLGGIIKVQTTGAVKDAFGIVETPKVPGEVWAVLQNSKQSAESMSGADEAMVQGSMPQKGGSSIGRTATGAGNLAAASAQRIQGPVGRFVENVLIPFVMHLDQMITERMPIQQIRDILGEQMGEDFVKSLDMERFLNAKFKYECLAGTHLAAKKAMAQSLPLLIQIFENPHLTEQLNHTGWVVDVHELFDMLMEMSEWKNTRDVIRPMSDEEKKMYASINPSIAKIQGKLKEIQANHEARSQEIDQKAEARLASKLTEQSIQQKGEHENPMDRAGAIEDKRMVQAAMEPREPLEHQPGVFHTGGQ